MQHAFCERHAAASESRAPAGADFSVSLSHQRIEPQRHEVHRDRRIRNQFSVLSVASVVNGSGNIKGFKSRWRKV